MRARTALLLAAGLCLPNAYAAGRAEAHPAATLEALEAAIANGVSPAFDAYMHCDESDEWILDGIATGTDRWLDVALQLLSVSDGCPTGLLRSAVARAVAAAPERTLRLYRRDPRRLPPVLACSPDILDEVDPRPWLPHLRTMRAAALTVTAPDVGPLRDACLGNINSLLSSLEPAAARVERQEQALPSGALAAIVATREAAQAGDLPRLRALMSPQITLLDGHGRRRSIGAEAALAWLRDWDSNLQALAGAVYAPWDCASLRNAPHDDTVYCPIDMDDRWRAVFRRSAAGWQLDAFRGGP